MPPTRFWIALSASVIPMGLVFVTLGSQVPDFWHVLPGALGFWTATAWREELRPIDPI